MNLPLLLLVVVLAYLTGSIATAVWVGKIFHKTDVREHGAETRGQQT